MKYLFALLLTGLGFANLSFAQIDVAVKAVDAAGNQIIGETNLGPGRTGYIAVSSFGQENINCTDILGSVCTAKPGHFIFNTIENQPLAGLRKALFTSEHLSYVEITFRRSGGTQYEFYRIRLENVLVKHITDGFVDAGTTVSHQIELQAGRVGWTFFASTGAVVNKFGWNYTQNVEWTAF
jgi:type VI protein secretion system component Hcp